MRQLSIVQYSVFWPNKCFIYDVTVTVFLRDLYQDEQEEPGLTTPKFDVLTIRPLATPSHCEENKISSDIKHFLPKL